MSDLLLVLPNLLAAAIAAGLTVLVWRRFRSVDDVWPFFVGLLACTALWSLGSAFEILSSTLTGKTFWAMAQYPGLAGLPVFLLLMVLRYLGRHDLTTTRWQIGLFCVPALTVGLLLSNGWHHLVWVSIGMGERYAPLVAERGPWFWVHAGYSWTVTLSSLGAILPGFAHSSKIYRRQAGLLLGAVALPTLVNVLYVLDALPLVADPTPAAFTVSSLLLVWALVGFGFLDLGPVAMETVVGAIGDSVLVLDRRDRIVEINAAALRVLGKSSSEVIGRPVAEVYAAWADIVERYRETARGDVELAVEVRGEKRHIEMRIFPLFAGGKYRGRVIVSHDISERIDYQKRVEEMAYRDFLTGLPNRRALHDLTRAGRPFATSTKSVALLLFDLDRFKTVNDALGHAAGDELLGAVARRLAHGVRPGQLLSRIGGDEFAVLMRDVGLEEARSAGVELMEALQRPLEVLGTSLYVESSVGLSYDDTGEVPVDRLLAQADIAMYQAKQRGRSLSVYDPQRDSFTTERLILEGELHNALRRNELVVHYQPIVDLHLGEAIAVEALVRWPHPERGFIAPDEFLPLAESRGLAAAIDRYVMSRSLEEIAPSSLSLAVNVSARSLLDAELPDFLARELARTGVAPSRLMLELTEHGLVGLDRAKSMLEAIVDLGIFIAADDFGSGSSSLPYLRNFPIAILKLDRSLIVGLERGPEDEAILLAVLDMARALRLRVIAEGVETLAQQEWLTRHNCRYAQGFAVGEPMPLGELKRHSAAAVASPSRVAVEG